MSISSEISRISQNVSDSLSAVAAKGVTVPSGSTSDDLAGLIAQITGGGTGAVSIVDSADSAGGTVRTITALDISDTTATASDVLNSKYFYTAQGQKVQGTATGGSPNLQAKTNISPTTSSQTITADTGYDGLSSVQINAMPSGTAGTPTATKGTVSSNSVSITPSVTNTAGYISGGTVNGTAVTVSASELVSGTKSITENGTNIDVTNYASVNVNVSGGSSVQTATGTFAGTGTTTVQISCSFAPDLIYVFGDLSGSGSLRGIISFLIIKDTHICVTHDGSSSQVQQSLRLLKDGIISYNESNQSSEAYATYSSGTLTLYTVENTSSARFNSSITYSYKLIKWS